MCVTRRPFVAIFPTKIAVIAAGVWIALLLVASGVSAAEKPRERKEGVPKTGRKAEPEAGQAEASGASSKRPNILWLTSEDHGPNLGCYGDPLARTPNVDALAARGMRYDHVWSTAPVCAPARTALISGMYPASLGALHMRSMVAMPEGTRMYPQYLRESGYYCVNNSKTDYNLREPGKVWDQSSARAHWRNGRPGQPFFAIFNSTKSHESQIRTRPHKAITDPQRVRVPFYHPDTPETRQDWAQYYDQVAAADSDAGNRLRELEEAGLTDQTIVFYYADHGSGMPRHKRWPGNSGLHVPLIVYFPPAWRHLAPSDYQVGGRSQRLIGFVDFAPTVLSLAGIKPPATMQGRAFAGPFATAAPEFLFGQRGRMDERLDLVRSATDGRFVYLRNFHPELSPAQRVAYQFETPTTRVWNELFQAGKTTPAQSHFWSAPKPVEELYDLRTDPDEVVNLAGVADHQATLARFRGAVRAHLLATRDLGFLPESEQFARAGESAPADYASRGTAYPLDRILTAA
ncbi:MAG: sulfatase, partial [Planctomycetota bacterium]